MAASERKSARTRRLRALLLDWYEHNRRDLPWRRDSDPYRVWVSEIMLQQTRVAAVVERYQSFLKRFPTLISLALAPEEDVLAQWSGLGYYRRARMMRKTAQLVAESNHGQLPQSASELRLLPGIGAYTAAAIASIAHGEAVAVVDGNVERVLCRLSGWEAGSDSNEAILQRKVENLAAELLDPTLPGDFNQALMELGAIVCLPRNPHCADCPIVRDCATRGEHKTTARPAMQNRDVAHALAVRGGLTSDHLLREVLLEQRPSSITVMPCLWELPTLIDTCVPDGELRMTVRHSIMQVNYAVRVRSVRESDVAALTVHSGTRRWVPLREVAAMALTGLTRKILYKAHMLLRQSGTDEHQPEAKAI
jgi:A/G-specific adenine glycosylase